MSLAKKNAPKKRTKKILQNESRVPLETDPKIAAELRPFIPAWLDDRKLKPSEFRVFCHVARCGSGNKGKGCCFTSVPNIALKCQLSPNTVRKSLQQLVKLGLLTCNPRHLNTTTYKIVPGNTLSQKPPNGSPALSTDNVPF